jgi:peptidoglycan/LPS O-acetylase OafA/YrhL
MPGLDGMRALAVVAVMVYHADHLWLHGGFLGVEVFFVISGYLITLLLITEHETSGRVSLRQFWLRRFRRLIPALCVMLGLLTIYLAIGFSRARGRSRGDVLAGLSYGSNWYQIWVGAGYTANEAFAPLRHLWSLAVEEQFYLLWPLVMVLILRRGRERLPRVALWLLGASIAIAAAVAVLYVPGDIDSACRPDLMTGYWKVAGRCISINDALYLGTFSRAGGLLLGAAFAMVWRPRALMRGPMRTKGHLLDVVALLGLGGLGLLMWHTHLADQALTMLTGSRFDPWLFRGGLLLTGVATVFVIAAVTHPRAWMGRVLGMWPLRWIGTRSYGLYLFHWPIYQIIRREAGTPLKPWQFAMAMAITVPITELSYRVVERPIRQGRIGAWLRDEHRRPTPQAVARRRRAAVIGLVAVMALGYAGVSVALAPNRCLGVVECANQEGQALIESQSTVVTVPAPVVTAPPIVTVAPVPTVPGTPTSVGANPVAADPGKGGVAAAAATTTTPTTVAGASVAPYAVGESVMKGATRQLQAGGFLVNAEESRQGQAMVDTVGQLRASGQIGDTIVIQMGTNGPVADATYDAMMSNLPPSAVPHVVFLTVHAPRGWIAANNARIWALPSRYPNVTILDWDGLVTNGQIPGMSGDGIHLRTDSAKQTYANYIFGVIGRPDLIKPVT